MSSSDKKLASAVGGKSARACDNCIKKRARWYCAADDAFLCQNCDSSVHSANPLAKRHERVRLKTTSFKSFDESKFEISVPTWHQGFTRKSRSPRQKKLCFNTRNNNPLVPEICSEKENEEQLLYQVPTFDPFVGNSEKSNDGFNNIQSDADFIQEMNHLDGFLPSEMDLAEFAANVESLLGKGLEDESFDMESLGLLDCEEIEKETKDCFFGTESVKFEDEGVEDDFEFNFDYDHTPITGEEEDVKALQIGEQIMMMNSSGSCEEVDDSKKKIFLKLDYDGVLSSWDDQKSPWTTGERPDLDTDDCWPDCMGSCGTMHMYGGMGMIGGQAGTIVDGAREARVLRYREKRQKRLFSKKIRYEVRKLNAQKRPRMKGRFVKRSNLVASPLPTLIKA